MKARSAFWKSRRLSALLALGCAGILLPPLLFAQTDQTEQSTQQPMDWLKDIQIPGAPGALTSIQVLQVRVGE
ncbi:MAG TPA: hypothetical protein PLI07_12370, partial [Candidatus Hydrogenedentes bacterium]|nr:hypothetical protein [Candidatus Hydrogenedentota bacterium]